jgi:glutamate/tyrosine decarboxylase-like PLP-dependent enzyme
MLNDLALFDKIAKKLLTAEKEHPVVKPMDPETLKRQLDLSLDEEGIEEDRFIEALESIILSTPRTASNMFFNQLFGGRQGKASLGELLAVVLNSSMYTYKVAGPQVLVEKEIINKVNALIGYGEQSGGTMAAGGSMTNLMAMIMARDKYRPEIRTDGVFGQMTMYTSRESHYSIEKNASFIGLGRDQVRYIATNSRGEMRVDSLEAQIKKDIQDGFLPVFINITAGTTVMGAFDPIKPVTDLAKKHKMWVHVDGAYCGAVFFSPKYAHLIEGVELADSFSFNAHKMLGVPLSSSIIVVKDNSWLEHSFSNDASYLYQTDTDEYNLGKTSLQCGRRNDALKFWTLWKSIGTKGLARMVEQQFELADTARTYIRQNDNYELYSFDESISICFNYKDIPAEMICTSLYEEGELMVGFGKFRDDVFIRLVTINSSLTETDIHNFFEKLESFVACNEERFSLIS